MTDSKSPVPDRAKSYSTAPTAAVAESAACIRATGSVPTAGGCGEGLHADAAMHAKRINDAGTVFISKPSFMRPDMERRGRPMKAGRATLPGLLKYGETHCVGRVPGCRPEDEYAGSQRGHVDEEGCPALFESPGEDHPAGHVEDMIVDGVDGA